MSNEPVEDVLEEAKRLTSVDRQAQYGPPDQDFTRTAKMWSALKGVEFESRDVAMFLICLKLSRETHQRKRDNAVDIAGYARCLHLCNEALTEPAELIHPIVLPRGLPPLPRLPDGFSRWEYRGMGWGGNSFRTYACVSEGQAFWSDSFHGPRVGLDEYHYIEAV